MNKPAKKSDEVKMLKQVILFTTTGISLLVISVMVVIFDRREIPAEKIASTASEVHDKKYADAARLAEGWLKEIYLTHSFPSVSAAVGIDGQLIWAGAIGFSNIKGGKRATTDTRYRIGSVSKPLTATALMILYEKQMLDINQSFATYGPEIAAQWPDFSIYQLATHQAGIRHYPQGLGFYSENFSRKEYPTTALAVAAIDQDKLLFSPGTDFYYSTYGYTLLALAMENASGKPFETLMQDYLFHPAHMSATILDKADQTVTNIAVPYMQVNGANYRAPAVNLSYKYAGGGFLSTPSDIVRFGNALLDGSLISRNTRDQLWQTGITHKNKNTNENYAIGFFRSEDLLGPNVNHGGMSVGGLSYLVIYPEQQMVIAFHTNATPMTDDFSRAQAALNLGRLFK
jgi:serine beta-lactamase-like protein LACTB